MDETTMISLSPAPKDTGDRRMKQIRQNGRMAIGKVNYSICHTGNVEEKI